MSDWKKFKDEMPNEKLSHVWVHDPAMQEVWLVRNDSFSRTNYEKTDYLWLNENVEIPLPPQKERHRCVNGDWQSKSMEGGTIQLSVRVDEKNWLAAFVDYCPFCGYKPEGR